MILTWDFWRKSLWADMKKYIWAEVLKHLVDNLKDTISIPDSQLKDFIKNLSNELNINEYYEKFISNLKSDSLSIDDAVNFIIEASFDEDVNITEIMKKVITKSLPDENNGNIDNWDKTKEDTWFNLKEKTWFEVLGKIAGTENLAIKEYITAIITKCVNSNDDINITDSSNKDINKTISDISNIDELINFSMQNMYTTDIDIFETLKKIITINLPKQDNKLWNEYINNSFEELKDKTWLEVLQKLADTENITIDEYIKLVVIKYANIEDIETVLDIIKKDIVLNLPESSTNWNDYVSSNWDSLKDKIWLEILQKLSDTEHIIIDEYLQMSLSRLLNDNLNLIDLIKKDIHLKLPKQSTAKWIDYVNDLWNDCNNLTWNDILLAPSDTENIGVSDFIVAELQKIFNESVILNDLYFIDFVKTINETLTAAEFISKLINKNITDKATVSDTIRKDTNKNINEKLIVKDEMSYKLNTKSKTVSMDILDMDYCKIAILTNAWDVCISQIINGEYSLTFKLPLDEPCVNYIDDKHYIRVEGQIFMFTNIVTERTQTNEKIVTVEAQHVFFELDNFHREIDDEAKNYHGSAEPYSILNEILLGTGFEIAYISGFQNADILLKRGSQLDNLKTIVDAYKMELWRDNYKISFYSRIGTDKGLQFRYSKNIKSIKKSTDIRNVFQRLYVYGKDGLTIDGVNNGKAYLDSQYISSYKRIKTREITFNDIEDPKLLLEKGKTYLAENEVPKITYDVNVIELKKLSGMIYDESFGLGDSITVIDKELGADVKARIVEYKYYPFEPKESSVVLGNFLPRATDFFSKWNDTTNKVDNVFFRDTGKVNTKWLQGIIDVMQNKLQASGAYVNAEVLEDKGFLLENTQVGSPSYGAMYLGPGIFAIADQKNAKGQWDWRTFGTGAGFTADVINTGTLNASLVNVTGLVVGENVTMGPDAVIEWDQVTNQPFIPDDGYITKITKDTVTTSYVNALEVTAKNAVTADKVNANWIYAGNIVADQIKTGTFNANYLNVIGLTVGDNVTMGSNAVIQWNNVANTPKILTDGEVQLISTKITENTVTTSYINALDVTAKDVNADWVYTGALSADQIVAGKIGAEFIDVNNLRVNRIYGDSEGYLGVTNGVAGGGIGLDFVNGSGNVVFNVIETGRNYEVDFNAFGDNFMTYSNLSDSLMFSAHNDVHFSGNAMFHKNVDFTGANVTGLEARFG